MGGLETYREVGRLLEARALYPALRIPIICVPATIGNNLPATDFTIGADTALNNIVNAVDKIKYTASAARRVYIIEVMGRRCGYLALTSGIATGAEMELLPEDGISLHDLQRDTEMLRRGFDSGKKLGIVIIAEESSPYYDTDFVRRVIDAEARGAFDVRVCILGHLQRGGVPTAFDRIQGARLGARAAQQIMDDISAGRDEVNVIGLVQRGIKITPYLEAMAAMDMENGRPQQQAFLTWRRLADRLAKPGPGNTGNHR